MKWFISLLLLLSYSSMASTQLYIKDKCTGRKVSILNPNGLNIELSITKYEPRKKMTIKTEFFPVSSVGEHVNKAPVAFTYHYNEANSWRGIFGRRLTLPLEKFKVNLLTPKLKDLILAEKRLKTSNLWMVRVSWYQAGTKYSGVAQKSFLRLNGTHSFFEVKSAGICHWETSAAVSSKLFVNENMGMMNVIRNYDGISQYNSNSGMSLGPNNMTGNTPLSFDQNTGWFFRDWNRSVESQGVEHLERKWVLNRHESGVFGIRHSFTRKNAKRWVWAWDNSNKCQEYQVESEGVLDIGMMTEDFYILPQYMHTTVEMNEFIENYRPTMNTCTRSVNNGPEQADDVIVNKDNSILYYYIQRKIL